jgi:hypothetical protein
MAIAMISLSDESLLGEYVPIESFRGLLERRLAVGPDLAAILLRDGKVVEAAAGANIAVGGFWRSLKDGLFGRHALRLLIADLKPFQLKTAIEALTRDHVPAAGEITIELQLDPERPANVLGLVSNNASLAKRDVFARLAPHLGDRVFAPAVHEIDARDLRGNVDLNDKLQGQAMTEVERLAGDLGLLVRSLSVEWALNAEEIAAIQQREREREQQRLDAEAHMLDRAVAREGASTIVKLQADFDIEKFKSASDAELQRLLADQEITLVDARATAQRIEEMKALQHRIAAKGAERRDNLQAEIEAAQHEIALAKQRGDRQTVDLANDEAIRRYQILVAKLQAEQRGIERATEDADRRQAIALKALEDMQELEIAAKAHEVQVRTLMGLQGVEVSGANAALDRDLRREDAEHRRRLEQQRVEAESTLAKMSLMKDLAPDLVLAINAGLSKEVANVLVEQARARAGEGSDKMQLMREMIDQAREGRVASEAQARHFFEQAMGAPARGGAQRGDAAPPAEAECPNCHRVVTAMRFCSACGQQLRA